MSALCPACHARADQDAAEERDRPVTAEAVCVIETMADIAGLDLGAFGGDLSRCTAGDVRRISRALGERMAGQ